MAADEEPRARFCFVADYETGLQHGPGRVLFLVCSGAAAGLHQSHRVRLARNPGGTRAGVVEHHRPDVGDPQAGGGGDRQWPAGAGTGRWHTAREERQVHRRARRELAVAEAGPGAPERPGHHDVEGTARPRHHRYAPRLRPAAFRGRGAYDGAHSAARWPLVHVDLYGKHGRVRTIPMPTWVKVAVDAWTAPAGVVGGYVFRPVIRGHQVRGDALSEKVVWQMLRPYAKAAGVAGIAPHDCRRTAAKLCRAAGGELEQIQLLLGHASVQTTERYLGTKQDLVHAPNDRINLRVAV